MKYIIVLLLFLNGLAVSSIQAQELVKDGNQWNIATLPTFEPNTSTYSYLIEGDTIFDDLTYKKVYSTTDSLGNNWVLSNNYLRENQHQKVYLKQNDGEEILLYDFSLNLGDTFQINQIPCQLKVVEIDTIKLNNEELRKRMRLELLDFPEWGSTYWIEGIGSLQGVFNYYYFCTTDYSDKLLCHYLDGTLLYPENPPSCFITSATSINKLDQLKLYPNPTSNIIYIEANDLIVNQFQIYTTTGVKLKEGQLHFQNERGSIDLSEFKQGAYILLLLNSLEVFYTRKVVKY